MITPQHSPPLFLLGQKLSELIGVDNPEERLFHVCGGLSKTTSGDLKDSRPDHDPWTPIERRTIREKAAGTTPHKRVGLVCDAGLGKTTNLQWLAAAIASGGVDSSRPRSQQIPLLLRLDNTHDLELLARQHADPDSLVKWMAAEVTKAARGNLDKHQQALTRLQISNRITLLIDGLDHALHQQDVLRMLWDLLHSVQWRDCPVWVAGRPYAFDNAWELFSGTEWHFLHVEPLAEREIRFYLTRQAGGDWYDEIAPEGRGLLAVPRLLRLIAGILEGATRKIADHDEKRRKVRALNLGTVADVYHLAYFTPGKWIDPVISLTGQIANADSRGLIAAGLVGKAAYIGLLEKEKPSQTNHLRRINRTATLLGAIAFEMFGTNPNPAHPEPNVLGVPEEQLENFLSAVDRRLRAAGQRQDLSLANDFDLLIQMNNAGVDFLLFRYMGQKGLVWHDRTVQAFFAAYWAMKHGSTQDFELLRTWVVDGVGKRIEGFNEFWSFAADLPDPLVETVRWIMAFKSCYTPPQQTTDHYECVQWNRRMICHSWCQMQNRSPKTIQEWRSSFLDLAQDTGNQQRIYKEITGENAFKTIPAKVEGAITKLKEFSIHQWQVTNEMYEQFDPHHRAKRWPGKHPLFDKTKDEDCCPVVMVTWFDAWCFAAWCGQRLPTELEWEHACRGGSGEDWCFGSDEAQLEQYAWYNKNSDEATHPVGKLTANKFGLHDMHGNVWEWCEDRWNPGDSFRVIRGGGWVNYSRGCLSTNRTRRVPEFRDRIIGFRLAAVSNLKPI